MDHNNSITESINHKNILNQQKIDARLTRIANVLLLNSSFIDNLGLLNGKMGIAIFFYQYSRYSGNTMYSDYAGELIDEIYEGIDTSTQVDFANGLTGIGWGIEYLVNHNFLEADTDEVLEDFDKAIYQSYLNRPYLLEDGNDVFGYGFYFMARLKRLVTDEENLNELIKKQHLIYLTDECERILIYKRYLDFNTQFLSTAAINSLAWFLLEMHKLDLFPSKTEKLIKILPDYMRCAIADKDCDSDRYIQKWLAGNFVPSISDPGLNDQFKSISNSIIAESRCNNKGYSCLINLAMLLSQMLIFGIDPKSEPIDSKILEGAIHAIEDEEIFSRLIFNINKDNLGLSGLSAIGLGLIYYLDNLSSNQEPASVTEKSKMSEQINSTLC